MFCLRNAFEKRMFCEYVVKKKTYCNDSCEEREKNSRKFQHLYEKCLDNFFTSLFTRENKQ